MALHLYLLRHAQSAEKQQGQSDIERELTPRGIQEAAIIGSFLKKEGFKPEIIVSSSANRAKSTSNIIADALQIDHDLVMQEPELYEASPRTLLSLITNFDMANQTVLMVGHNPTISYLAEYLTKAEIGDMTTGGIAIIEFKLSDWSQVDEGKGDLVRSTFPAEVSND